MRIAIAASSQEFTHQLEPFRRECACNTGNAGHVAAGPVEACHKPFGHWIAGHRKNDGNRRRRPDRNVLGDARRRRATRGDQIDAQIHEFGGQSWNRS